MALESYTRNSSLCHNRSTEHRGVRYERNGTGNNCTARATGNAI
jgi:hypothetical protein